MTGNNRILITGGTGYIGSSLLQAIKNENQYEIMVLVRNIKKAVDLLGNDFVYFEINDDSSFNEIIDFNPNIVIHLAAFSTSSDSVDDIKKLINSNITFTALLLDALMKCDIKIFINTGSFSEYYHNNGIVSPTYFYSVTKSSAKLVLDYYKKIKNFKLVSANLFTVYGKESKNKKIIDYAIMSLNSDKAVNMSEGFQILDFIHIDDIVNFYIHIIKNYMNLNIKHDNYFIGTGIGSSIRDMVRCLEEISKKKANINWGACVERKFDTKIAIADTKSLEEDLLWKAKVTLTEGLKRYFNAAEKNIE